MLIGLRFLFIALMDVGVLVAFYAVVVFTGCTSVEDRLPFRSQCIHIGLVRQPTVSASRFLRSKTADSSLSLRLKSLPTANPASSNMPRNADTLACNASEDMFCVLLTADYAV